MARTREFKNGIPLFIALDHRARGGMGLNQALREAAAAGGRCFMEIDPLLLYVLEKKYWMPSSPAASKAFRENQAYFERHRREIMKNARLYDRVFGVLASRDVTVIPLERNSLLNIRHRLGDKASPDLHELLTVTHRERSWVGRLMREAEQVDFVVAHPNHVYRLKLRMHLPEERLHWIHEPDRAVVGRGLRGEAELLARRALVRRTRERRPRARPQPEEARPQPRRSRVWAPFNAVANRFRRWRGK